MTKTRVCVIDDDDDLRETLVMMLGYEGYEVSDFASAREAIRRIEGGQPVDVILLDLMMPEMNGWEFCRHRMQSEVLVSVPVIVITARRPVSPPPGVSEVIYKPFDVDDLLQAISKLTAGSSSAGG
jgi:CheY-like chemotaxis protein